MRGALAAALGVTLWLAAVPAGQAQQVMRWRQPDGTTAYSVMPPAAGASAVREVHLAATPASAVVRSPAAVHELTGATPSELRDADAKVARAHDALAQAEQAVRAGQEPLPGERQRLVNGHSRLTSAYFDRIAALESAVARARAELRAAQSQRAALEAAD
ncbi:MAG: hypothetical protein HS128_06740 [Ideonella sp.]|nr:hypothetical protein [Ideonella sp.]